MINRAYPLVDNKNRRKKRNERERAIVVGGIFSPELLNISPGGVVSQGSSSTGRRGGVASNENRGRGMGEMGEGGTITQVDESEVRRVHPRAPG